MIQIVVRKIKRRKSENQMNNNQQKKKRKEKRKIKINQYIYIKFYGILSNPSLVPSLKV